MYRLPSWVRRALILTSPLACPSESDVLRTPRAQRWSVWASDAAHGCCPLPGDGVSCGPSIGPCCVKRVPRPEFASGALEHLLPPSPFNSCDAAAEGIGELGELASCLVLAARAGSVEGLRRLTQRLLDAQRAQPGTSERDTDRARRLTMASLLSARALVSEPVAMLSGLDRTLGELRQRSAQSYRFDASQRDAATSRKILFSHVSKAGGTALLQLARQNLRAGAYPPLQPPGAPPPGNMWRPGDGPLWCPCADAPVDELSCPARERVYQDRGYQLMAVERYLDNGGELCPALTYVGLLRDPVPRVLSHINHWCAPAPSSSRPQHTAKPRGRQTLAAGSCSTLATRARRPGLTAQTLPRSSGSTASSHA